ncbi:hypothetical protein KUTeg_017512 [Tegillarca granosa]|uniref:M-phase inducer phosphatase n=1 Tax=Tegillarca granosa TaxID=220873 RepID=A0ABQ9EGV4_TEGGR|nr:hypothetical protein KUTeg_017512 [Tegillarca granosa]
MPLFDEEDCGFEDVCSPNLFTPTKTCNISTSSLKKTLLFHDEDSGLGMDNETRLVRDSLSVTNFTSFKSLKRNLSDEDMDDFTSKRQKRNPVSPKLRKTLSFDDVPNTSCEEDIKNVVNRLAVEDDLISDGSGQLCLPTVQGKHHDLNNITHETMASVLLGDYDDVIGDFKVIDCRYPYEYNGGHIKEAENIYTHDGILQLLNRSSVHSSDGNRAVLIFHCEFSSERGPKLCRYLRSKDRELNSDNYPYLNYPEIYLLYGGYKEFYTNQKEFCNPQEYKPMLHCDHAQDLRHFRSKSKSWTAGEKRRKRRQRICF